MAPSESEENRPRKADGLACQCCDRELSVSTIRFAHRTAHAIHGSRPSSREVYQAVTSATWSEAAREVSKLFLLCTDCHAALDGGELDVSSIETNLEDIEPAGQVLAAGRSSALLVRAFMHVIKVSEYFGGRDSEQVILGDSADYSRSSYDVEYSLSTAMLNLWHDVAGVRWGDHAALALIGLHDLSKQSDRFDALLAGNAAHDAWSAAIEVRQTYLSPDITLASRVAVVQKFARDWLGWKANVPEEKTEALIDALLSDEWPSARDAPDPGDVPTLLRGLVRDHYSRWRPYDVGQINGKSIASHSIQMRSESGEIAEFVDLLAGPDLDFAVEPHVMRVKNVLAELDPLEREVCLTYATCDGRKSWKRAARLNGLPNSFGENRVRRMIKTRLQELQNAHARLAPRRGAGDTARISLAPGIQYHGHP